VTVDRRRGVGGLRLGSVSALLAIALPALGETAGSVGDPCPEHLFVIERSKNANIVVYDANRGPSGDLSATEPIVAYWLLNGENGKREELNRVDRDRAYGFDVAPGTLRGHMPWPSRPPGNGVSPFACSTAARW
jgi:hypothetical protein